jgi:two-component system, sporulation sensor kinase E
MENRLKNRLIPFGSSLMDVYQNKVTYKVIILLLAMAIGGISLVYTNFLVEKLEEREKTLIDLYAKSLEYLANAPLDENVNFISSEIIEVNTSIPVILTGEDGIPLGPENSRNIQFPKNANTEQKMVILLDELELMKSENDPIPVVAFGIKQYIFFRNSDLLYQLRWYPYVQLSVIAVFAFGAYYLFSISRRSEQNRVWVGLARETAHQLGTPLSSLMAWLEYFREREKYKDEPAIDEIEKDIERLEVVTKRFSNIGSVPIIQPEDMNDAVQKIVSYLEKRVSNKIEFKINSEIPLGTMVNLNKSLFQWVIENICKNAVDSMEGIGKVTLHLFVEEKGQLTLDISDTGRGIPKQKLKQIFRPGYTSKKRGWGLGLTLSQRIIEKFHKGKIFVKSSHLNQGTIFRILLPF